MSLDAWSGEGHVDLAVASDPGLERAVVLGWLIRFAACPGGNEPRATAVSCPADHPLSREGGMRPPRHAGWHGLALITLMTTVACGGEEAADAGGDGAEAAMAAVAANPCDANLTTRDLAQLTAGPHDTILARVLAGTVDFKTQTYDCQRLVLSTGPDGEFGPLVGLFPVEGVLAQGRSSFATARPAVSVHSWGAAGGSYSAAYEPLGIGEGSYCLWLQNPSGAEDGWRAALAAGPLCGDAGSVPAEADFRLPAFERTYPGAVAEDYPSTARWEWDLNSEQQVIGLRCGEAWCAVAAPGSSAPSTTLLPDPLRGSEMPRLAVPGWSDAQHLAVYDEAAGVARPGPWGTVLSHPALHQDDPAWSEGILAAAIVVEDSGPAFDHFAERYYLQPGNGSGRGDMLLRFPGASPNEAWFQQGPERRRLSEGRVTYTPALTEPARGAVRWRWREGDPEFWIFCRGGSCSVEG